MKRRCLTRCAVAAVLLAGIAYAVHFYRSLPNIFTPTTDPAFYTRFLLDWERTELVDHFPSAIPADATEVRLSSFPGMLQGGGWFQVRMKLPAVRVEQILRDNLPRTIKEFNGGEKMEHVNKFNVASTYFFTSGTDDRTFPATYRILVFGNSGGWNHGTSHGLAIDQENQIVVYWAESW